MIRQELETQFGLEEGTLDESEYKKALKRAIKEAVVSNSLCFLTHSNMMLIM